MSSEKNQNVLVFIEQRDGHIESVSKELLGIGRQLADKREALLIAVLLGHQMEEQCQGLMGYGADRVLYLDHKQFIHYMTEPYTQGLIQALDREEPSIFLIGATAIGRDLAPRVSARIHTGLTADCTALAMDETGEQLLMTRPAFGGNLMATIICPEHRPQMATVRPGVMQALKEDTTRQGEVVILDFSYQEEAQPIELLEVIKEGKKPIKIEEAKVLISGGRGVGKGENFEPLFNLAEVLGGEVSSSRAVVDAGWQERDRQVGQTGKTVRPNLYFACGISGAIQHVAGMEESDLIIAVNTNKEAPIFEIADVGIVGDLHKIIPKLTQRLKKERKGGPIQ